MVSTVDFANGPSVSHPYIHLPYHNHAPRHYALGYFHWPLTIEDGDRSPFTDRRPRAARHRIIFDSKFQQFLAPNCREIAF